MKITIIQPSLRKDSYTYQLCKKIEVILQQKGVQVDLIDLREKELQFCDGREIHEYNTWIQDQYSIMKESDLIIMGFPVYHYEVSGVLKNFLDICGDAMTEKKIAFVVSAIFRDALESHIPLESALKKKFNTLSMGSYSSINTDFGSGKLSLIGQKKLEQFAYFLCEGILL